MHSAVNWRLTARIALPVLALCTAAVAACRDTITDAKPSVKDDVPMMAKAPPSATEGPKRLEAARKRRGREAERFHGRNRMTWVGEAHNKNIEAYLAAKRGRKFSSRNLCKDVVDFFDTANVYPTIVPQPSREQRRAMHRLGARVVPCGHNLDPVANTFFNASYRAGPAPMMALSSQAWALMTEIGNSLDASATPEALAVMLNGILDRGATLPSEEADAVAAVASVTQSSFEYWDANYEAVGYEMARELAAQGDECLVSGDPARCSDDGDYTVRRESFATPLGLLACRDAKASRSDIAKADFVGAIAGAVYGGWATFGLSVLGTATVASVSMMLWNVAVDIFCWFAT